MRMTFSLFSYFRYYFIQWLGSWSFVATTVLSEGVAPVLGWSLWTYTSGEPSVSIYYLSLALSVLLTSSAEHYLLSERIFVGSFSDDLLRPQPALLPTVAQNLAMRTWHLLMGAPILIGLLLALGLQPPWRRWIPFVVSIGLAGILMLLFRIALGLLALWSDRVEGLANLMDVFVAAAGGVYVPLYLIGNGTLHAALMYLPFWSMLGAPAEVLAGTASTSYPLVVGVQTCWTVILSAVCLALWRAGQRRLELVGG